MAVSEFKAGKRVTIKNKKGLAIGTGIVQERKKKTGFYSVRFDGGKPNFAVNYPACRLELVDE